MSGNSSARKAKLDMGDAEGGLELAGEGSVLEGGEKIVGSVGSDHEVAPMACNGRG